MNPKYADAFYNRGRAKNHLYQYKDALKDLEEALRLNPNDEMTIKLRKKILDKINK